LLSSDFEDKKVYSKNMVLLGSVKDLEVDTKEMKATHLVLEVEKQVAKDVLGKLLVIRHAKARAPTSLIESIEDAIVLNNPINELKGLFESL
jgi:sporulation protein YlmC with PRC-barrel domain